MTEKEMYMLVLHNKCNSLGQYYGEDDWRIILFGESIDDIRKQLPKAMFKSRIFVVYSELFHVTVLVHNGEVYIKAPHGNFCPQNLEEDSFITFKKLEDRLYIRNLIEEAQESDEYKSLVAEKKRKIEEEKKEKQLQKKKEREEKEKDEYLRLKKKFEGER